MNHAAEKTLTIDDESLAMLLDEVSAMAGTGRSLDLGLADFEGAAMGKLGRAARQVRVGISRGEPAANAIAALSSKYRSPVEVAMRVMAETGSTEPIDEAVWLIRAANEHRQQIMLAAINPLINIVVAATVLFFVMPWILVSISEAELIKPAFAPLAGEIQQTFARDFMLAGIVAVAVIGVFAAILYWALTRSLRGIDAARDHGTFCRWMAMQVTCANELGGSLATGNAEVGHVIESAATVVGPEFAESWATAVENVRRGCGTADSINMPSRTPEAVQACVVDLVSGCRDGESIAADLRQLNELYQQQSHRRRAWWINVLPRWIAGGVMIAIIVLLLQTMLAPLFDVVSEVAG